MEANFRAPEGDLAMTFPLFQVEVSPLENAIEVIENKNLQLRTLITQCQSRQMQNINPLTMCLNGVIDAAVNGGLARYQEVRRDGWKDGWMGGEPEREAEGF